MHIRNIIYLLGRRELDMYYVLVLVLYKNVILNKSCSLHQNTRNEGWNTLLDSDSDDHLGESLRGI